MSNTIKDALQGVKERSKGKVWPWVQNAVKWLSGKLWLLLVALWQLPAIRSNVLTWLARIGLSATVVTILTAGADLFLGGS